MLSFSRTRLSNFVHLLDYFFVVASGKKRAACAGRFTALSQDLFAQQRIICVAVVGHCAWPAHPALPRTWLDPQR